MVPAETGFKEGLNMVPADALTKVWIYAEC
jgi:hypothetical protein